MTRASLTLDKSGAQCLHRLAMSDKLGLNKLRMATRKPILVTNRVETRAETHAKRQPVHLPEHEQSSRLSPDGILTPTFPYVCFEGYPVYLPLGAPLQNHIENNSSRKRRVFAGVTSGEVSAAPRRNASSPPSPGKSRSPEAKHDDPPGRQRDCDRAPPPTGVRSSGMHQTSPPPPATHTPA